LVSSKTDSEIKRCVYQLDTHIKIFISNIFTEVAGEPIGSILKGQTFQEDPWKMGPICYSETAV